MRLVAKTRTLLLLALFAAGPARAADDLGALLKKTLEAYGGQKALAKAASFRQTGTVVSTMRQGAKGQMVRTFSRPLRLRVEISYPDEPTEVRIVDGAKGWRGGLEVKGPPLDAMGLQAARLALPMLLVEKKAQLKDGGLVERDGTKLRSLELPLGEAMSLTVLINPSTGVILHTLGKAAAGGGPQGWGGQVEFGSAYADFRKVDGVLFPFQEITFAMGQHTGETTLEKIELLPRAPKEAFEPQ